MNFKVAALLRRILPLLGAAPTLATETPTVTLPPPPPSTTPPDSSPFAPVKVKKLVYGLARAGQIMLAGHRSHSSHSSHRSHSSHYSGSGGSYPSAPSNPYVPPPAESKPVPKPPPVVRPNPEQEAPPPAPETAKVLAKLPKVRSHWPVEARLIRVTQFTLYDGDKAVGVIRLEPGTRVKVVAIKPAHAVVRIGATESTVPVLNTDIIERMGGAAKILALPDDAETEPAPQVRSL